MSEKRTARSQRRATKQAAAQAAKVRRTARRARAAARQQQIARLTALGEELVGWIETTPPAEEPKL